MRVLAWVMQRLRGRGVGLTCVGFNKMEVIAGTLDGRILVWWISTGDIMRDIKVGPRTLQ